MFSECPSNICSTQNIVAIKLARARCVIGQRRHLADSRYCAGIRRKAADRGLARCYATRRALAVPKRRIEIDIVALHAPLRVSDCHVVSQGLEVVHFNELPHENRTSCDRNGDLQ
jgi:hypothetical protein